MKRKLFQSIVVFLICFTLLSCTSNRKSDKTKLIKSTDGKTQITVPENWKEEKDLNDSADLQASDRSGENYIIVLSENKKDFDKMTIEQHSELTRSNISSASSTPARLEGPKKLTINGHPALEYEIYATVENLNAVYLHVTIETPNNFHQILAWTLLSKFEKNKNILQQVIETFKETTK